MAGNFIFKLSVRLTNINKQEPTSLEEPCSNAEQERKERDFI